MDVNQTDIGLLHQNPGELIVKYQPIVTVVVQLFMKSGYFKGEQKEEIIQQINEKLLNRIDKIREQYNGIAQLRTYFSAVVRNLCLEIIRRGNSREVLRLVEEYDHNLSYSPDQLNKMIINQELKRLDLIFSMFYQQRAKMVVAFKAMGRIPLSEFEWLEYCGEHDCKSLSDSIEFLMQGHGKNDKQIYKVLTLIFNTLEKKNLSLDATRKWISCKEDEIISLLNGDPPRSFYNHETLRILMEKYFMDNQFNRPVFHLAFEVPVR